MKQYLILLTAICLVACDDAPDGWADRASVQWARTMGEENPRVYCQVYGSLKQRADCSTKVGDRVYALRCYYNLNQTCEQRSNQ
jgi:hypothetical protein